jgi:hypothetical protein
MLVLAAMVVLAAAEVGLTADPPVAATSAKAAVQPAPAPTGPVTVLDGGGVWRTFHLLKPPVAQTDNGLKPILLPKDFDWANRETPAVPADWAKPEFNDTSWLRGPQLNDVYGYGSHAQTPYLAKLYLRNHFMVADPAQVKDLKLTVSYFGGAIVYVNGQELTRGDVAKSGAVELADAYPEEAFAAKPTVSRERSLKDVAVPAKFLHKGVNTLAIEIVRAPYNKIVEDPKSKVKLEDAKGGVPFSLGFNTCQMGRVSLVAAGGDGVATNLGRPVTWQAWNSDLLTLDRDSDRADRCVPLGPVVIRGARNGWYSGKMAVGSPKALEGLKATVSDLKLGSATIPASAIRLRYGSTWDGGPNGTLEALLEAPVAVFPAGKNGTIVPIWLTLKIPAAAKVGTYTGQLTVAAKGEQTITTPVTLEVADFTLPDQDDWRTWVELIQSPDTLALEYDVPLWSDKHWALIEQSLRYIGEMGSRTTYIPLIAHTNFGNAESMVRWIKKADGTYDYDFSIMDKYLDLVQKNVGQKLKVVTFNVWEIYLFTGGGAVTVTEEDKKNGYVYIHKNADALRWQMRNQGPAVTGLERATGKTETIYLPRWEDPAAKAAWKPLFDELHKRMAKRGLEGAMAVAMVSDTWPTKKENDAIAEVSGNLPWVNHTHGGGYQYSQGPVKYKAYVWNNVFATDPSKGRMYGWQRPDLTTQYLRFDYFNRWPLASLLYFEESNITGQQRGAGRIGADFWRSVKDGKGRRAGFVADRYPESFWHSLNMMNHLLTPAPNGPVAMAQFEVFREGVQQCEARIAIESVLTDATLKAKLPAELAQKGQAVLDERLGELWRAASDLQLPNHYGRAGLLEFDDSYAGGFAGHAWFVSSGWQDRTQKFYALAGEVVRKASIK